jgi:hypothetical protein
MNVHTLQITTVHTKSQAVMSLLVVAWLQFSLYVASLWLLTMEVLHGQPRIYCSRTALTTCWIRTDSLESESYVMTDGQSAGLSWYKAPIRGLRPDFYFRSEYGVRLTVTFLISWGALSDERTGLSFVCAAGLCQRSLSRVVVPWDLRPYFTVSDLRLPFSSPPTTRRVTVEVFDPDSFVQWSLLYSLGSDHKKMVPPVVPQSLCAYSLPSNGRRTFCCQNVFTNHYLATAFPSGSALPGIMSQY